MLDVDFYRFNYRAGHICVHTRMFDVDFNGLNYRVGRLFIDSDARCGFLQTRLPCSISIYRLGG